MQKYRKKPITIEAVRWNGHRDDKLLTWLREGACNYIFGTAAANGWFLQIRTLEGVMNVSPGDYIIKGVFGEFYPCRGGIFEQTYELATEANDGSGSPDTCARCACADSEADRMKPPVNLSWLHLDRTERTRL